MSVVPAVDQVSVRLDGDEVLGQLGEPFDRLGPADGHSELDWLVGQIPYRAESTWKCLPS